MFARNKMLVWLLPLLGLALLAAGCNEPGDGPWRSTGSYPIDIFQEMHYNQTFKAQEPPRVLPPAGSVPITGKEVPLPAMKTDATGLQNPEQADPAALERAAVLYHINCSTCHGSSSLGDGPVGLMLADYGAPQPPAFTSDRVEALSSGEAYWSITNGFGFMPPFGNLLNPRDRWLLVHLIELPASEREALLNRTEAPGYK